MRLRQSILIIGIILFSQNLFAGNTPNRDRMIKSPLNQEKKITGYNSTDSEIALNYYNKAYDYSKNGDFNKVIENYKLAIAEDSLFIEAYDNIGLAFRQMNELDSAVYYYKLSLSLYPEGVFANQNLGVAYMAMEDYDNALLTYQNMTKIIPDSPEGYYGIAQVKATTFDYEEALEAIDIAIEKYEEQSSSLLSDGYLLKAYIFSDMKDKPNMKKNLILAKENGANLSKDLEKLISSDSEEEKVSEEVQVIKAINWYLETPLKEENKDKIKKIGSSILTWIIKTPKVSVMVDSRYCPTTEGGECLLAFMFAWTKYTLENDALDKPEDACYNAIRITNGYYLKNKDFIGNYEEYNKLIELEMEGKLKERVKEIFEDINKNKK